MRKRVTVGENARIQAIGVTESAFSPFGKLIDVVASGDRTDKADGVDNAQRNARFHLSTIRIAPPSLPLSINVMERHAFSSQSFLPLDAARYLICVAENNSEGWPDMATLRAFIVPGGTGITYRIGTWHHPMTALDRPASFAIMMWCGDNPDDELVNLSNPVTISED